MSRVTTQCKFCHHYTLAGASHKCETIIETQIVQDYHHALTDMEVRKVRARRTNCSVRTYRRTVKVCNVDVPVRAIVVRAKAVERVAP